jgi:2-oxoglutarate ferredoxin oxidoreductase subunit gamma
MHEEVIIAGFGGQGALFAGQLLAYAGLAHGRHVTWIPSYGPEMRGGTAHCTVIISDEPIGSPLIRHPSSVIALNLPSFEKYEEMVRVKGCIVYNSSLISRAPSRADIRYYPVPANAIAEELGSARQANMVCLGAWIAARALLPLELVSSALGERLSERQRRLLSSNQEALRRGAACVAANTTTTAGG